MFLRKLSLFHQILELLLHQLQLGLILLLQLQLLQSMFLDSDDQRTLDNQQHQSLIVGAVTGQMIAPAQVIGGALMTDHLLLAAAQGPAGPHPDVKLAMGNRLRFGLLRSNIFVRFFYRCLTKVSGCLQFWTRIKTESNNTPTPQTPLLTVALFISMST